MNRVNPFIAKIWSKVLHALPNSCLTLLCGDPVGAKNFTDFMLRCGIEEGRIFFIDRADYEVHLRRQSDFDLFLDTTPYNAHTTASDALRRGLPIVTLLGSTFSGRVAASLLFELGIPELVCSDETEYVDTCVRFACDLSFRANIHSKLRNALLTGHLFNPRKKVIELESILKSLLLPVTNMR
jgi:predicted O-linked N-acetylglucosamine transferase (SPINDLY family)